MRASPARASCPEKPRGQFKGQALNSSQKPKQQQRGNLLAQARCLVNISHFLTPSHREALSAHTDTMLDNLSCSYKLNHYLGLQQALGIDSNWGGVTSAKHQL